MKIALFTTIAALALCTTSYAIDGSLTVEMDGRPGHVSPDLQAQVGQTMGDFRPFVAGEWTKADDAFPNSPYNYRAGVLYFIAPNLSVETGIGHYNGSVYGYGKGTVSFDTGAKK